MSYTNRNYIYVSQLYKSSSDTGSDYTPRIIIFDDNKDNIKKIEEIIQKGKILGFEFLHETSVKYLSNCINIIKEENLIIANAIQDIKKAILRIRNTQEESKCKNCNLTDILISDINLSSIKQHVIKKVNNRMAILPKYINIRSNSANKEIHVDLNNDFSRITSKEYRETVIKLINLIESQYIDLCCLNNLIEQYKTLVFEKLKDNKDIDFDYAKINLNTVKLLRPILNCFLINLMSLIIFIDNDNSINLDNNKFVLDYLLNLIQSIRDNKITSNKIYHKFLKILNSINNLAEKPIITFTDNNLTINYSPISKSLKYL